ncbi:hypothetical protein ACS0TY_032768 [Phlomoides rotata]
MNGHIKRLEIFSYICHKEGLVFSEKKSTIRVNMVEFLGVLIDQPCMELQGNINIRILLKANEKFVWKQIHTQRIRELKQVCKNFPKLAILQDNDELEKNHADTHVISLQIVKLKVVISIKKNCIQSGSYLRNDIYSYLLKNLP